MLQLLCMYVCMCNVRIHITIGFINLTNQCVYVYMDALTEVGTSYMDMKEGMPVCMYVCTVCMYVRTCQNNKKSYWANADISACMYAVVRIPRGGHEAARLQSLRALATH